MTEVRKMDSKLQSSPRNPSWRRDELILALDHYLHHRGQDPRPGTDEILLLTGQIAKVSQALGLIMPGATLRNPDAVAMKLRNFSSHDPNYTENGRTSLTRGNKLEAVLWKEFAGSPLELRRVASGIMTFVDLVDANSAIGEREEFEAPEGRLLTRVHQYRERNPALVKRKKTSIFQKFGRLSCEVCGFDFLKVYGERGRNFIECHHTVPVSTLGENGQTSLNDLALVCANCHRMIHASRPWWSIQEAKEALRYSQSKDD
jgi:5-methylcytosine-specific restriction protein A